MKQNYITMPGAFAARQSASIHVSILSLFALQSISSQVSSCSLPLLQDCKLLLNDKGFGFRHLAGSFWFISFYLLQRRGLDI